MRKNTFIVVSFICFFFVNQISAKVALPAVFSNNMVLQQQSQVPFWGTASANKTIKITTSWNNSTVKTTSDASGNWKTTVATPIFGGPYSVEINDGTKLMLENILIGEVWICSGQSNMEMPLAGWGKILNYEQEIASANYPNIRLLHVDKKMSNKPLSDVSVKNNGWVACSPATIAEFSSVAYFFAKNLYENKNVPIGLINTSWGGTVAETWVSSTSLKTLPDFVTPVEAIEKAADNQSEAKVKYDKQYADWQAATITADKGSVNGKALWADNNLELSDWKQMEIPNFWETELFSDFDGVVWFRKTIDIPADWANKELTLSLDRIDDNDTTYFEGVKVGSTEGYSVVRNYKIPASLVKGGKAIITIRVLDWSGGGGIYGLAEKLTLSLSPDKSISLAGTWLCKKSFGMNEIVAKPKPLDDPNRPSVLFNSMIHPIAPFTIKGAIWYQGESNADRAYQYRELFPTLIKDWRKAWNINFPFYFVQLANFTAQPKQPGEATWAELREAQLQTLHLENTGMAVAIDLGDAKDIHPKNKQEVGRRLSLLARALTYGENILYSGPIYESYRIEGKSIRISFKNVHGGLKTPNNESIKGFAIAGTDHRFKWADARIEGNDVIVSCESIENPIAVRYGWAANPNCNLYNNSNLPASPFRTDDWRVK